jgi:hypothetical protein
MLEEGDVAIGLAGLLLALVHFQADGADGALCLSRQLVEQPRPLLRRCLQINVASIN